MTPRCSVCGLKFQREEGYFLGAMYISFGLALGNHRSDCAAALGCDRLVDHQSCRLGSGFVPAPGCGHFAIRPRSLDLPGPGIRSRASGVGKQSGIGRLNHYSPDKDTTDRSPSASPVCANARARDPPQT